MKILAFLQQPAFPIGTSDETIRKYNNDIAYRRTVLRRYMTGQRILLALGEDLFNQVDFDNVIWHNTIVKSIKTAPDMDHVIGTIQDVKPDLILTFGSIAKWAIENTKPDVWSGIVLSCRHPNARGITTMELEQFGRVVRRTVERHND